MRSKMRGRLPAHPSTPTSTHRVRKAHSKCTRPGSAIVDPGRIKQSEKQQLQFGLMAKGAFGAFSPQWTIPSSRKPPEMVKTPGPSDYDIVDLYQKRPKSAIGYVKARDYSTLTSDVEWSNNRFFPERRETRIGELDGSHYFMPMAVSPGPTYHPPHFGVNKGVTIGPKRRDEPPSPVPGPGAYTPCEAFVHTNIAARFPRRTRGEVFTPPTDETPGPGSYETRQEATKAKRWAGKLRVTLKEPKERPQRDRPWAVAPQSARKSFS